MTGYFRQFWYDNRLTWDPEDWDGIKTLRVPYSEFWIPDISSYKGTMRPLDISWEAKPKVVLNHDGRVIFVPAVKIKSPCYAPDADDGENEVDGSSEEAGGFAGLGKELNCTLKVGSWVYDQDEMDIELRYEKLKSDRRMHATHNVCCSLGNPRTESRLTSPS